ncbi:hypothetical protein B0H13DRAFT_2306045 [Mycena leptocephala]|nr:hypothetical protein B0H13DRAFT_2306045 [Mycena leptocephala]
MLLRLLLMMPRHPGARRRPPRRLSQHRLWRLPRQHRRLIALQIVVVRAPLLLRPSRVDGAPPSGGARDTRGRRLSHPRASSRSGDSPPVPSHPIPPAPPAPVATLSRVGVTRSIPPVPAVLVLGVCKPSTSAPLGPVSGVRMYAFQNSLSSRVSASRVPGELRVTFWPVLRCS